MAITIRHILPCSLVALAAAGAGAAYVASPGGRIKVDFNLDKDGTPRYEVTFNGKSVVKPSALGFRLLDGTMLNHGFRLDSITESSFHEVWAPVWGETDSIDNTYRQLTAFLSNDSLRMDLQFRVFDDGVGFRYIFPAQPVKELKIAEELSEFAMPSDMTAWWIPGDYDTQEYEYNRSRLSGIRAINEKDDKVGNVSQTSFSPTGVQTSLMLRDDNGTYVNLHEAALVDYPAMHLDLDDTTLTFRSWLTPGLPPEKALLELPRSTPWRVIMIGDRATDILASNLVLNLNEPNALDDTSWIHPTKYMGVWWEMITGKSQWSYTDLDNVDIATVDYSRTVPHGKHGANNENVRRYIDFAADNGFDQVLVEGWNIGWEDWLGKEKENVFDFVTPYPDFDLQTLNDYARSRGVKLMMHHETSGSVANYEARLDTAYNLMNRYGYDAVKSGYVGNILPRGETHYSQRMVNHYLDAVKRGAAHKIMVNAHEAVRPTGLSRTYPNLVGNESAMGTEYRNMSPGHVTVLPFTRLKGGPMDFTPGIFRMDIGSFVPGSTEHKKATVANQLALYVTMYSPLQMAADLPEHYAEKADAFRFIREVPADWSESIYPDAEPGDFIVAARRAKGKDDWYVGAVSAEPRVQTLPLTFLPAGKEYEATIYRDAPDADCMTNPEAYEIVSERVDSSSTLTIPIARGGGFAISLHPAK